MILGQSTALELGLRVIRKRGFWDMPDRKSPVSFQWGDELQPLVNEEDISYQALYYEVDFLFDPRITVGVNPGQNAESAMEYILGRRNFELDLEYSEGGVSDDFVKFNVRVSEFKNYKIFQGGFEIFTAVFVNEDPVQDFIIGLNETDRPLSRLFTSYFIVGGVTEAAWFSLRLKKIEGEKNLSGLDRIPTSFSINTDINRAQANKKLRLDFLLVSPNTSGGNLPTIRETIREISQLKGFLSKPGIKRMQYTENGHTALEFYLTEGFQVREYDKGREMEFTMIVDVIRWL